MFLQQMQQLVSAWTSSAYFSDLGQWEGQGCAPLPGSVAGARAGLADFYGPGPGPQTTYEKNNLYK